MAACAGSSYQDEQHAGQQQQQLQRLVSTSQSMAAWLCKHRELVDSLVIRLAPDQDYIHNVQQLQQPHADACDLKPFTGLATAATAASSLLQRVLQLLPSTALSLPTQWLSLASRALTRLEWPLSSNYNPTALLQVLPALERLQSLGLHCIDTGVGAASLEALAPALMPLTQLTSLKLQHFSTSKVSFCQLPEALVELEIGPPLPRLQHKALRDQQLQLQGLPRLQQLRLHSLKGCDVLPAGLTALHVGPCNGLPLLALSQLKRLSIVADVPEQLLVLLTQLPALQDLQLTSQGSWFTASAFNCLSKLPLTKLHLSCELPPSALPALGQCMLLTSLHVEVNAGTPHVQQLLAGHLAKLTALTELSLSLKCTTWSQDYELAAIVVGVAGAAAMQAEDAHAGLCELQLAEALLHALQSLPQLHRLRLRGVRLSAEAHAALVSFLE